MTALDYSIMYPMWPIIASITMILCLIASIPHFIVGNLAIVSLALWTSIGLLMTVINTCVWRGNIRNSYPIWGDIVAAYYAVLGPAIASCTLCVQYRLWSVARIKSVFITKREKRMEKYVTIFFCLVVPIIIGLLHYVVQGHRYNLFEDLGPLATTYDTWMSFILYYPWEPLFCLLGAICAMHTLALFFARRKELDIALSSGSININRNRYVRLMLLAAVAVCIHFPLAAWVIFTNALHYPVYPWISWEDTHSNFNRIDYVTRFLVKVSPVEDVIATVVAWFSLVLCGINFFIFFGFGEEAMAHYKHIFRRCLDLFGIHHTSSKKRTAVKKSWLDILLHRPGRPRDVTPTATIPEFNVDEALRQFQADSSIDVATSDYQETAEMQRTAHRESYASTNSSKHAGAHEDSNVEEKVQRPSGSGVPKIEEDLEAQPLSAIEQQRRREILEKNPDMTEEVSF